MSRLVSGESVHFVSSNDLKKETKKMANGEKQISIVLWAAFLQQLSLKVCERLLDIMVNILYDIMFHLANDNNKDTLTQLISLRHFQEHVKMQTSQNGWWTMMCWLLPFPLFLCFFPCWNRPLIWALILSDTVVIQEIHRKKKTHPPIQTHHQKNEEIKQMLP